MAETRKKSSKQRQMSSSVVLLLLRFRTIMSFSVCGSVHINYIVLHHTVLCEFFNYRGPHSSETPPPSSQPESGCLVCTRGLRLRSNQPRQTTPPVLDKAGVNTTIASQCSLTYYFVNADYPSIKKSRFGPPPDPWFGSFQTGMEVKVKLPFLYHIRSPAAL